MLLENSIKAGLCGSGAITTGIKFNPGLTNASDQMTVQIHIAGVSIRNHLSVCTLEVNTFGDGIVHLAFDFPHESVEKGLEGGGGRSLPLMWPIYDSRGPSTRGLVQVVQLAQGSTGLLFNVTFNFTRFNIIQQLQ